MVNKTLGYYAFETQELLKIARLNTLFVERCNQDGQYKDKPLPDYLNLKKDKEFSDIIDSCVSF